MVFYMPGHVEPAQRSADDMSPREIVQELDRHVVGQAKAKRAVAIAMRNRIRRRMLPEELAEDVIPKNILMIGPTGVGKTEIARRLARLAGSPFLKVEASKFTEVGYVGRDVESMVRDLVELACDLVRQERREQVRASAAAATQERLLDLLLPPRNPAPRPRDAESQAREREERASWERSRETLRAKLEAGELEQRNVEVEATATASAGFRMFTPAGMEEMDMNLREMMPGLFKGAKQKRRMTVEEAREHIQREEEDKRIDPDRVARDAIQRVEQSGILFIDEIDKIAGAEAGRQGPDVSREGVQRDLLPIVEGTLVHTKYGMVRTDHVLFIAAGAFHVSKPSDLIPELQGRFPIRVELDALGRDELVRILTEPEHSLVYQQIALMKTEGIELEFTDDGVLAIAEAAADVNQRTENIGARRLTTIIERLLEEISFAGAELSEKQVRIDAEFVHGRLDEITQDTDLSRFIL
ncbi:MAG: ATP-dependent protease ATPase subunit HslU [Acidobacteria bacterium]|nr:ATP-dependent protease ATPase subunit HslU [Acidobacteriota bacterium]NIM64224.1 ATP-dependent protease ATPase subunit HslU [Acidobacteriota bacterium]NIO59222.1 ATP-dependent protease ATPase subunit HslU [Acidobacteriota bacterium]NIQ30249.1 ATP-dependent protease ATPase subunit HslU [Acidobacteriota bacterium]NIQ85177.1 ATP-dependent protease ATPase subunit HslU [Acidobacteriota bacterium]